MARPQLYITWFDDERGRTSYYLDRVRQLDIPKPNEQLIKLTNEIDHPEEVNAIKQFMDEHEYERAFIKTECKAAVSNLKRGSFILENSIEEIQSTVESLLTQNNAQDWPHGEYLVIREWVDLNFCMNLAHSCHPEVRYFISNGEVIGRTPVNYGDTQFVCSQKYTHLTSILNDSSPPDTLAQRVAEEFDEASWGVDFAMDTNGDWHFIEMNFNGVYWNDDEEQWWDMCGQGDNKPYGPVWTHSSALPDLN